MARKKFGLRNFFLSFIVVVIAIYLFQNYKVSPDFMVVENGIIEDLIKAEGIVIKDEKTYSAPLDGSLIYYYQEGRKIKVGELVADIITSSDADTVNRQIAEIQSAIDNYENTVAGEESLSQESFTLFQNEIQLSLLNDDLEKMYDIVGQVNSGNASYSNTYSDYSLTELQEMKRTLMETISTNKVPFYSDRAGIISYTTDGLEDVYKFENALEMTPSSTGRREYSLNNKSDSVEENEIFYKIIRNFEYYIAVTVNNDKAKLFEENKYIKVRIISDGGEHIVWGYIEKINYGSEESVLILYFDDYFYKIYNKRYLSVELITATYEGLKIKNQALVEKDGLLGVYVQDASNIIKFFPVEILGSNEEYSVISPGSYLGVHERNIISIGEKIYSTIKSYDKVILEPDKVYEGQIAD